MIVKWFKKRLLAKLIKPEIDERMRVTIHCLLMILDDPYVSKETRMKANTFLGKYRKNYM